MKLLILLIGFIIFLSYTELEAADYAASVVIGVNVQLKQPSLAGAKITTQVQ